MSILHAKEVSHVLGTSTWSGMICPSDMVCLFGEIDACNGRGVYSTVAPFHGHFIIAGRAACACGFPSKALDLPNLMAQVYNDIYCKFIGKPNEIYWVLYSSPRLVPSGRITSAKKCYSYSTVPLSFHATTVLRVHRAFFLRQALGLIA